VITSQMDESGERQQWAQKWNIGKVLDEGGGEGWASIG